MVGTWHSKMELCLLLDRYLSIKIFIFTLKSTYVSISIFYLKALTGCLFQAPLVN